MPPSSERDSLVPAYHRHDIRLLGYDYSTPGTYFITICVQNRACILGDVVNGEMTLNKVGSMIDGWWMTTDQHFAGAESDAYMIMPNYFHALVRIGWTEDSPEASRHGGLRLREGEGDALSTDGSRSQSRHGGLGLHDDDTVSLAKVVQWFKSATTTAYSRRVASDGWPRFPGRLWQQNYYEHIIRNQAELDRARGYVMGNPGKWSEDAEYRPYCPGFSGNNTHGR